MEKKLKQTQWLLVATFLICAGFSALNTYYTSLVAKDVRRVEKESYHNDTTMYKTLIEEFVKVYERKADKQPVEIKEYFPVADTAEAATNQ